MEETTDHHQADSFRSEVRRCWIGRNMRLAAAVLVAALAAQFVLAWALLSSGQRNPIFAAGSLVGPDLRFAYTLLLPFFTEQQAPMPFRSPMGLVQYLGSMMIWVLTPVFAAVCVTPECIHVARRGSGVNPLGILLRQGVAALAPVWTLQFLLVVGSTIYWVASDFPSPSPRTEGWILLHGITIVVTLVTAALHVTIAAIGRTVRFRLFACCGAALLLVPLLQILLRAPYLLLSDPPHWWHLPAAFGPLVLEAVAFTVLLPTAIARFQCGPEAITSRLA